MMEKPFAITLDVGSSLANKTGAWRTNRPVYVDRLPPCNHACPAGENIQGWLYHAESGDYEAAWRVLVQDNPLPAVMGRVCYHPCETACNRGSLDEAVGINSVERFLGDEALKRVASTIFASCDRSTDLAARFGGEEFALVLPGTPAGSARLAAEKLRRAIEAMQIPQKDAGSGPWLTVSIGAATAVPREGQACTDLIQAADRFAASFDHRSGLEREELAQF